MENKDYLSNQILYIISQDNASQIYSPKKKTQHVKKYSLLQIFNIILNTEISITLL